MKTWHISFMALVAFAVSLVHGAELISNGNFESGLTGWTAVPGSGMVANYAANSPFNNVYPAGASLVGLSDDAIGVATTPYLYQVFSNQTNGLLGFSFDIGFPSALNQEGWMINLYGGNFGYEGLKFFIGHDVDYFVAYNGATESQVLPIEAFYYYNVTGTINLASATYSGTIRREGGGPSASWSNFSFVPGHNNSIGTFVLQDLDASAQNPSLFLDNVSIQPIPEPQAFGLIVLAVCSLTATFRRCAQLRSRS